MKKLPLIIAILFVASAGLYYFVQRNQSSIQLPGNEASSDLVEMGDVSLGYNFQLPTNYTKSNNGQFSRLYSKKSADSGAGPTNFIYISVVPVGKVLDAGEIYNYSVKDTQTLGKLQLGESTKLGGITDQNIAQYYTYTRIDDVIIGGYGAKGFKNENPWEFPSGTVEYRYIIPFAQATFLIGGYTGTTDSPSTITKAEMDALFTNFKITPDTITFVFTSPIPEKEWVKFTSEKDGISFEYPSGWTKHDTSQNFQEGDLFTLTAVGQSQRPQTELYDGVSFSVMKPIPFQENLSNWMKNKYDQPELNPDRKPEYSKVSFGGKTYEKVVVCGLGCFTYYHIVQNGKLYGFVVNAVGPHESSYTATISKILSGVVYY